MTIHMSMCNLTTIVVIKFLATNLPSQPLFGRHLDFTTFSPCSYLKEPHLFLQHRCFGIDITFCNNINNSAKG